MTHSRQTHEKHPSIRQTVAWLHNQAGLVLGWLFFLIALAGTLSVFRPEITQWVAPELSGELADPVASTAAAVSWLQKDAPDSPVWHLTASSSRAPFTQATWYDGKRYVQRFLDPVSGSANDVRDTLGGEFFYRFHFELQLPFPYGRLIAAFAAVALVVSLLSGVIVHRRFFADFFTLRGGGGRRSWLDLHNLCGVSALPFHLMIPFTGAVSSAPFCSH